MRIELEIIEALTASVAEQAYEAVRRNAPAIFRDLEKGMADDPDNGGQVKATIRMNFLSEAPTKAAAGVESLEWERKVKNADKDFRMLRMDLEQQEQQPELQGMTSAKAFAQKLNRLSGALGDGVEVSVSFDRSAPEAPEAPDDTKTTEEQP